MTSTVQVIRDLKEEYGVEMASYAKQVRGHIKDYGPTPCEYLMHRQMMSNYYRGGYNSLVELEKRLKNVKQ